VEKRPIMYHKQTLLQFKNCALMEAVKAAAQLLLPFSKLFEELRTRKGVYIHPIMSMVGGGAWGTLTVQANAGCRPAVVVFGPMIFERGISLGTLLASSYKTGRWEALETSDLVSLHSL
jgi:hypothetical protein